MFRVRLMKLKELKEKPQAELLKLLEEKRGALGVLRFKLSSGGLKNVREPGTLRKEIARLLTLINLEKKS